MEENFSPQLDMNTVLLSLLENVEEGFEIINSRL